MLDKLLMVFTGADIIAGNKANKEAMKLAKAQYDLQMEQFEYAKELDERRIARTGEKANLNLFQENLRDLYSAQQEGITREAVRRGQGLADTYAGRRTTDVTNLFGAARAPEVEKQRAAREKHMIDSSISGGLAGKFSQTGSAGGAGGGWSSAYNAAINNSASVIENEMKNRALQQSYLSNVQDIEGMDQIGASALSRSDAEEDRMTKALGVDKTIADTTLEGKLMRKQGEIAQRKADIEHRYNLPESIFMAPDPSAYNKAAGTADLISNITDVFGSAYKSGMLDRWSKPATATSSFPSTASVPKHTYYNTGPASGVVPGTYT
jgi:hypothetical protein